MQRLNTEFVRSQFPAFSQPELSARSFFENAGGSYTCTQVQDRLKRFYSSRKMQPSAFYAPADAGMAEMDEAQRRLARMLNVAHDELVFGPSTSMNVYVLAQAFAQWLQPGDAIIVTDQDHEANSGPWRRLAAQGVEVREWQMNRETGLLDTEGLVPLLDDKVRLLAFPHVSNIIGAINDVVSITQTAQQAGAYVVIDGVSYAPHGFPDIGAIGADVYLFSAYKTFGPHQGIMAIKRGLGLELPNQGHYFNHDHLDMRFAPAGPDHAQVAASAGIADYVDAIYVHHLNADDCPRGRTKFVHDLFRGAEVALMEPLLDFLSGQKGIRLLGPRSALERAPTLAADTDEDPTTLAIELAKRGVLAGAGDFYAVRPLKALGIDPKRGVLRMSFLHYTNEEDVARLIRALDEIL